MAISQDRMKLLLASGEDMYRDDVTPDTERIAGLFPRGYISVIASMPGAGKTWLMQYISCQLSVGGRILDGVVAKSPKYKSLILAGETGKKMLDKRLAKTNWGFEPKNIRVYEAIKWAKLGIPYMLNTVEGQETIAAVVEIERPSVIWFDTFISFHTADEGKVSEMTAIYQFLLRMANYYNLAVVLNHHTRKKPSSIRGEKPVYTQDDVIGSSAGIRLANAVYIITTEQLDAGRSIQTVTNAKSWDKKVPPFSYEFIEDDNGDLDFKISFDTEGNNIFWSARERLREYISSFAHGAMITVQDAAMYLHMTQEVVRGYLEEFSAGKGITKKRMLEKITLMGKNAYRVL